MATHGNTVCESTGVTSESNMQARADISLYPLTDDYIPPIRDVIARLAAHSDLEVQTNALSTQVSGDYDRLMAVLQAEAKVSLAAGKAVFVIKLLSA